MVRPGDRVRLVSPASWPSREGVDSAVRTLESWGLVPEIGDHALDRHGYMAGTDVDRVADFNDALRDPRVRAIVAIRGGAGSYRIIHGLDFDAARNDPKPFVGFSDVTNIHLALYLQCGTIGVHGAVDGSESGSTTRQLMMSTNDVLLTRQPESLTAHVRVEGVAVGPLIGGNLREVAGSIGSHIPNLDGALLLLEDLRHVGLGQVDRNLSQLINSGAIDNVAGVVLGAFTGFGGFEDRGWKLLDVLQDRLGSLGVPVAGGFNIGHTDDPTSVPIGAHATLDATVGTLSVSSAVSNSNQCRGSGL